jgi:hypothetical protein
VQVYVLKTDCTCSTLHRSTRPLPVLAFPVAISAPVGDSWTAARVLNRPDDTRTIQAALNRFPPIQGGPSPPLVVDGGCGKLTRDAILHFQRKWDLTPKGAKDADGVVDVEGPTIDRLRAGPGRVTDAPAEFLSKIPRVMQVVTAARAALLAAKAHLQLSGLPGRLGALSELGELALDRADRHFHVRATLDAMARLDRAQSLYLAMQTAIGYVPQGIVLALDEPPEMAVGAFMFSASGGYHARGRDDVLDGTDLPAGSIYVCPKARALSHEAFAYVMVHELAHFCAPETGPGVHDFPGGYFHRSEAGYRRLTADQAIRNADSYAQFAFDAAGKRDFNVLKG